MRILELVLAVVMLLVIFAVSSRKYYLLTALIANFPVFSFFTFSISGEPQKTAVYLSIFSLIVSISFLVIYFTYPFFNNKFTSIAMGVSVWIILSFIIYFIFKMRGGTV